MLKTESYRKGIVFSSIFNVFAKGLVFLNSLVIAYYFGTEIKMDIYFYSYNTITIVATFISGANSAVVIPESMRVRIRDGEASAEKFLNIFIYGYLGFTLVLCLLFLIDPISIFTSFSKYDVSLLSKYTDILYFSTPLLLLISVTTLLTDIMASYRYFTVPVGASIINSIFSFLFLIIFHDTLDVRSILFGLILSYSLNIILLIVLMKRKLNWNFSIGRYKPSSTVWKNILYSQTGNFVTSVGSYAPLYFLSGTVAGIIASLNYAQQVVAQANSFITYQISVVSRIRLSELYAKKKYKKINEVFLSTIRFLLFVLLPVTGLLFLYSTEIISLLFRRGSFDQRSVEQSSELLKYLSLSLPFTAIISIAGNLYVAAQLIKASIIYQIISNVLLIFFIALFVRQFSYIGYPVAYTLINILNVFVVYIYCRMFFPFIRYVEVFKYLGILVVFNGCIVLLLSGLNNFKPMWGDFTVMIAGGALYVLFIIAIGIKFKINQDFNNLILKFVHKIRLVSRIKT